MTNQYSIEQRTITLYEFYRFYKNNQLGKPPIQRKKRWSTNKQKEFIQFTIQLQNIIIPLLMDKTIANAIELFSIIDGNNRTNSIVSFFQRPIVFFDGFEIKLRLEYPEEITNIILNMSYDDILEKTSLNEICSSMEQLPSGFDAFEWYKSDNRNDRQGTIEHLYKQIHKTIRETKFDNIKMLIVIFNNMNEEQIVDIYNKVNTTGVRLTSQEIIKAVASLTIYSSHELHYFQVIHRHICDYILECNENEILEISMPTDSLSTYNVLFGMQIWLYKQFPSIIELCPSEMKEKDDSETSSVVGMDVIFKVYQTLYGEFKQKRVNDMNKFLKLMYNFIEIISAIDQKMYGLVKSKFHIKLGLNQLFTLIIQMFSWTQQEKPIDILCLERIIYYNEICTFVSSKKTGANEQFKTETKQLKKQFENWNPISYQAGGKYVENMADKILKQNWQLECPSRSNMKTVLDWLIANHCQENEYQEKRRKQQPTKFETLLLNHYFYKFVPPYIREMPLELDHIIPVSTNGWTGNLDINRIGNKMLINERVNLKKSNKAITEQFLVENELHYYMYPAETTYSEIVVNGIVQKPKYDQLCTLRETKYVNTILDLFV